MKNTDKNLDQSQINKKENAESDIKSKDVEASQNTVPSNDSPNDPQSTNLEDNDAGVFDGNIGI